MALIVMGSMVYANVYGLLHEWEIVIISFYVIVTYMYGKSKIRNWALCSIFFSLNYLVRVFFMLYAYPGSPDADMVQYSLSNVYISSLCGFCTIAVCEVYLVIAVACILKDIFKVIKQVTRWNAMEKAKIIVVYSNYLNSLHVATISANLACLFLFNMESVKWNIIVNILIIIVINYVVIKARDAALRDKHDELENSSK